MSQTVEEKIKQSLEKGNNVFVGNTHATWVNFPDKKIKKCYVRLHGNLIAVFFNDNKSFSLKISDAGWKTKTTKSRLNALLDWFDDYQIKNQPQLTNVNYAIYQSNYKWHIYALGESFEFDKNKDTDGFVLVNYHKFI